MSHSYPSNISRELYAVIRSVASNSKGRQCGPHVPNCKAPCFPKWSLC